MSKTDWDTCDQHEFTFPRHTECPYCRIEELKEENKRLQNGLDWEAKYPVHEELRKCNEYNRKLEARLDAIASVRRWNIVRHGIQADFSGALVKWSDIKGALEKTE